MSYVALFWTIPSLDKFLSFLQNTGMWDLRVFFISQLCIFFHATPLIFTLSDLARIIELSSAQLDRAEIANFAPVSWAMLLNSKEFGSEAQLKYTVLREALPSGA